MKPLLEMSVCVALAATGCVNLPQASIVGMANRFKPYSAPLPQPIDPVLEKTLGEGKMTVERQDLIVPVSPGRGGIAYDTHSHAKIIADILTECMGSPLSQIDPSRCIRELSVSSASDLPSQCKVSDLDGGVLRVVPACTTRRSYVDEPVQGQSRFSASGTTMFWCRLTLIATKDPHYERFESYDPVAASSRGELRACAEALATDESIAAQFSAWIRW